MSGDPASPDPVTPGVRVGERADRKDFILLFLAGARRRSGHGKSQKGSVTSPLEPDASHGAPL